MRRSLIAVLFVLHAWLGVAGSALAATSVQVLATDPPGEVITLGRNQNFYLRIGYTTDRPVSIWAQPYFEGQPAHAGSNPSRKYSGTGEALGWFFLMQPGDQVDEVRLRVGDGTTAGTQVLATYPVQITGGDQAAATHTEPAWVVDMRREDALRQRADYEARRNAPVSAGDSLFATGFMLAMLAIGLLGFAGPIWGLLRWRGGWRVGAALPAVLMGFVVLRLVIDTARDPTSHNLWPFEILRIGALSVAIVIVLLVARRIAGAGRST